MSDTPITDKFLAEIAIEEGYWIGLDDFTRQLERELAAAKQKYDQAQKYWLNETQKTNREKQRVLAECEKRWPEITWRGMTQNLYWWLRDLGRQTIHDEASRTELLRVIYDRLADDKALSTAKEEEK